MIPRRTLLPAGAALAGALTLGCADSGTARTGATTESSAAESAAKAGATERATLGGGCFWCIEAVFQGLEGVRSVTSGYAGGTVANPGYKQVCSGQTGHAEVIQVEFDPQAISFEELLEVFWEAHDPTTPNRQGADRGPQYRSVILYHSEAQRRAAEGSKRAAAGRFDRPLVTEIAPLTAFYPAEAYHQDFYRNNPEYSYCRAVIRPKLQKLEKRLQRRRGVAAAGGPGAALDAEELRGAPGRGGGGRETE
ncbi:MAG: peptide-methionine (S)-S-oxide reductase MsrA [Verrucomicrobia bacterium]|nr:peptide-methionine (S)-S-oxide reductase MsrA [Verrucomicrobiota bacterium]